MEKTFTGVEFLDALEKGMFDEEAAIPEGRVVREGMLKRDEADPSSLLFSEGTSWIRIPTEMMEKVEVIQSRVCDDKPCPYVRLHLMTPKDNPNAAAFAALLGPSSAAGGTSGSPCAAMARSAVAGQSAGRGFTQPGISIQRGEAFRLVADPSATVSPAPPAGRPMIAAQQARQERDSVQAPAGEPVALAGNWTRVATFSFGTIDACFYLLHVDVYRRWGSGNWDYAVGIFHAGVLQGGGCGCLPGQYRTGWAQARVNGTGGGYLDTGGLDVHSGGGDVWQYFYSVNPGDLQNCNVNWNTWCTF